jgi:L-threonylcarbamoyladenylate synthase
MKREIQKCVEILRKGGTLLYPTDTIWGIGCDATDADAVAKIYEIKQREDSKAMLVLVDSIDMLADYVEVIPDIALEILEVNDGPLTIVYPGAKGLAENLIAADGSAGIRITGEPFSRELIRSFGKPVVSSSANLAGDPSPGSFNEIADRIQSAVDHIVDWNRSGGRKRKPSGILKVHLNGEIEVIRE